MLTIRNAQLQAFRAFAREKLHERVEAHLRHRYPHRCQELCSEELQSTVARGIERAMRHGVTTIESIAFLCGRFFEYGECFENTPAGSEALAILENPDYPGQVKVLLIEECLEALARGRRLVTNGGASS